MADRGMASFAVERAPLAKPLSPMQKVVVTLLGLGYTTADIAEQLHISKPTVRFHLREAALKMPGDLPREAKAVMWVRGAPLHALTGSALRREVMAEAHATNKSYHSDRDALATP